MSSLNTLAEDLADEYICACCGRAVKDVLHNELKQALQEELEQGTEAQEEAKREAEKKVQHDRIFTALFKKLEPHEAKFADMLRGVWEKERKIILSNLKKLKKAYTPTAQKDPEDKVDQILYPTAGFEAQLSDEAKGLSLSVMDQAGQEAMADMGLSIAFDVHNPEVTKWLDEYYPMFSERLEEVNIGKLRRELIAGIEAGENIKKLSDRVNNTYDNWNKVRSETIARTETLRASNQGALQAYHQSGVVEAKEWLTHHDFRTCEFCIDLDGRVVELGEPYFEKGSTFEVGTGDSIQHMDLNYTDIGCPPLHALCRCTIVPKVIDVSAVNYQAKRLAGRAAKHEPRITASMKSAISDLNATLQRLAFRLKTQKSIARKLAAILKENPGLSAKQAANNIKDVVRYTYVIPEKKFAATVNKVHNQLESQGFKLEKVSNYYGKKGAYQGINAKYVDPKSGLTFEVQFHSEQSLKIAEKNHLLYEKARISADAAERATLNNQMITNWDDLRLPEGAPGLFK